MDSGPTPSGEKPVERVLLQLKRRGGQVAGKAVRYSDQQEFRFGDLQELVRWLSEDRDPDVT